MSKTWRCFFCDEVFKTRELAEGIAAPLEPTRQDFEKWANDPERRLHLDWDGERYELYEVELCWQAYRTAAAVSKNLQWKLGNEILIKNEWRDLCKRNEENCFKALDRIRELEKEIAALRDKP